MAGFRRLCGRFRCVGGSTVGNRAESAKFSYLRRLWDIVPGGSQGKEKASRAFIHARDPLKVEGCLMAFNGVLNGPGSGRLREV